MNLNRIILAQLTRCLLGVLFCSSLSLWLASEVRDQSTSLPVRSKEDWVVRRVDIQRNLQSVMGDLPEKSAAPLDLRILEEESVGGIKRKKITFVSEVFAGEPDRVSA